MNAHVRPAVPFTIAADLNLDKALVPWLRSHGADVTVTRGAVPESLPHPEAEGIAWQYADDRLLLRTPCGIRFLVEGACTVRYALDGGASLRDCRLFLLRAALPALAVQRGLLPLCASAVVHGEGVCAFVGKRGGGGGKSTLAAMLAGRGYPFFTDSVLLVDPACLDAEARCFGCDDPKLWPASPAFAIDRAKGRVRSSPGYAKLYVEPGRRAAGASGRLGTILFLADFARRAAVDECGEYGLFRLERLPGGAGMEVLIGILHAKPVTSAIAGHRVLFRWLAGLRRQVDVLRFYRPMLAEQADAAADHIAAVLQGDRVA